MQQCACAHHTYTFQLNSTGFAIATQYLIVLTCVSVNITGLFRYYCIFLKKYSVLCKKTLVSHALCDHNHNLSQNQRQTKSEATSLRCGVVSQKRDRTTDCQIASKISTMCGVVDFYDAMPQRSVVASPLATENPIKKKIWRGTGLPTNLFKFAAYHSTSNCSSRTVLEVPYVTSS